MEFALLKASLLIAFVGLGFAQIEEDFVDISPLPTVFETTSLPTDENGNFLNRLMASVGNGHISTTVYTDTVFMNGLYNGFKGESHRARIPSRNNIRVTVPNGVEVTNHTFALDVEKGTFFERFTASNYFIEQRTFAHRYYHKVIVTQIQASPLSSDPGTLEVDITSYPGAPSDDLIFDAPSEYESVLPSSYQCGNTIQVEDPAYQDKNPTACVIESLVPTKVHISDESIFTYFAAYDLDLTGASDDFDAVVQLVNSGSHQQLFDTHVQAWKAVWTDGRIELEGNVQLGKVIYGALYYILSSLPVTTDTNSPVGQFYGLSPGGLSYGTYLNDYQGHSFWDTEIWMYPSVLYFYPEAAREILNYRLHVLQAARDRAKETGYSGARFPWESCFTGREVTPDCCPETRDFQIHITGDIAFAIRQYIATTRDEDWLKINQPTYSANGCGLIHEIAQFWVSRATFNATTGHYDINGVMPPDEDHHDVNNSVYTNIIAGYAIFFAKYAECLCGSSMAPIPDDWIELAKSLTLLYDSGLDYHPEYDGYVPGTAIKQADVVLLGFPLMYNMPPETRKNDLLMYENVTRPTGPAMTWAMHTVGFLELDDLNKAEGLFNRSYQSYMRQPYKVWTEAVPPTIGAMNFITGMGGFLQSIVSGYGGLRLHPESLTFMKPRVPPGSKVLKLIGLNYLENKFDLHIEETQIVIKITDASNKYPITASMEDGTPIPFTNNEAVINTDDGPVSFQFFTDTLTSCPLPIDEIGGTVPFRKIFLNNEVEYLFK